MRKLLFVIFAAGAMGAFAEGEYILNSSGHGQTYDWDTAANWVGGEVPPADGSATVVVSNCMEAAQHNDRVTISIASPVNVQKLIVYEGRLSSWTDAISHGPLFTATTDAAKLTIGAGGLEIASFETGFAANNNYGGPPSFDVPLHLSATQLWKVNCHSTSVTGMKKRSMYFTRDITSAENIVWTIAGHANATFVSGSSAGFSGKVVFNAPVMYFLSNGQGTRFDHCTVRYEHGDLDGDGISKPINVTYFAQSSGEWEIAGATEWSSTAGWNLRICDDWTKTNSITVRFTGPVSGTLTGEGTIYHGNINVTTDWSLSSGHTFMDNWLVHEPGLSRFVFDWQNNGTLTTGNLMTYTEVEVGKSSALTSWAKTWAFRGYGEFGHAVGYYLKNGVSTSASMNHTWSSGGGIGGVGLDYMGVSEPGVATFSGTINVWGEGIGNAPIPVATAPKGGSTVFTGAIQGGYANYAFRKPFNRFEVCGEGEVVFNGSWTTGIGHYEQGPLIRGGTAVVAKNLAIGPDYVELGATVPRVVKVKGYSRMDMNAWHSWGDYGEAGAKAWNTTLGNCAAMFGSHIQPGDLILLNQAASHQSLNGVMRVLANGRLQRDTLTTAEDFQSNMRVEITDGPQAGRAYYLLNHHTDDYYIHFNARVQNGGVYEHQITNVLSSTMKTFTLNTTPPVFAREAKADPDCALRIGDGLDYTNSIIVNANLSMGESSIGGWTNAAACTVSGPIEMYRDVYLASDREGSVTSFTGSFIDHTETGTNIVVSAVGTADITAATLVDSSGGDYLGLGMKRGTLKVTSEQFGGRQLTWFADGEDAALKTGRLVVDGDLDVTGLESMNFVGFENAGRATQPMLILAATGALTGTLTPPRNLPRYCGLSMTDDGIVLKYSPPGFAILVR